MTNVNLHSTNVTLSEHLINCPDQKQQKMWSLLTIQVDKELEAITAEYV